MSSTRVPPGARGTYPAPTLTLTPGHVRNQALTVIAIPFVLIVVLAVVLTATARDDGYSAVDDLYGSGTLPDWAGGSSDDEGTSDDGTNPDGSGGLSGDGSYPWGETSDEPTDDTYDDPYDDTDGTDGTDGTTDDGSLGDGTETSTDGTGTDDTYTGEDTGPEATVTAYFDAINAGDYSTAWELGGRNLTSDYDDFVAGFATTLRDDVTIDATSGDDVSVTLVAWATDGTQTTFEGTYTVTDGVITSADVREGN